MKKRNSVLPEITYPPPPSRRTERKLIERRRRNQKIAAWVFFVLSALVLGLVIRTYVFTFARVQGSSMAPTLEHGQYVLVDKLGLRIWPMRRQDVILLDQGYQDHTLVKRVIGLPGDRIEWNSGQLLINGIPIVEPYAKQTDIEQMPVLVVPEDMVYVLGDDRSNSRDSRELGCFPMDKVIGRATSICWPLSQVRALGGYAQGI